jgi:hypothetical protein
MPAAFWIVVAVGVIVLLSVIIYLAVARPGATPAPVNSSSGSTGVTLITGDTGLGIFTNLVTFAQPAPPPPAVEPTILDATVVALSPPAPKRERKRRKARGKINPIATAIPPTIPEEPPHLTETTTAASATALDREVNVDDCQTRALTSLKQCQDENGGSAHNCWDKFYAELSSCIPSDSTSSGSQSGAALIFTDGIPITDKLDLAIEAYLSCMDSNEARNDRQSCVATLLAAVNASADYGKMNGDQLAGFAEAQVDLKLCLQKSTTLQSDFVCLRSFYVTVVETIQAPLLPVVGAKYPRILASNKAMATHCYQSATHKLRQGFQALKSIPNPHQRATAQQVCLREYRTQLNACICLSFGQSHPACQNM